MKMTLSDSIKFFIRLEYLLGADLTLIDSLTLMKGDDRIGKLADHLCRDVTEGKTLAYSLESIKGIATHIIEPVRIGEAHGALKIVCHALVEVQKQKQNFKRHIIGSLVYPALIVCISLLLVIGMFFFIIPRMLGIFSSMHMKLPLPTRLLVTLYGARSYWWVGLLCISLVGGMLYFALKNSTCRKILERCSLFMPILGPLIRESIVANLLRSIALLLTTGVPLKNALYSSVPMSSYHTVRIALVHISEQVSQGKLFSEVLEQYPYLFDHTVKGMMRAGDASGSLASLAAHTAHFYETNITERLRMITSLIEPTLMVFIGIIVGFVALALMLPLYEITSSLQR